jgi:hypothetical protein
LKKLLLIALLISGFDCIAQNKTVVLKITSIRGEGTVTAEVNKKEMENIFTKEFGLKGYNVIRQSDSNISVIGNLFFADVFFYQFPSDFPCITFTIRNETNQFVFVSHEFKTLFLDRQAVNLELAEQVSKKIPASFGNIIFLPKIDQLFLHHTISLSSTLSQEIIAAYEKDYRIELNILNIRFLS